MKRLRHPVRAIREPFGTAGLIVAVVALVAALAGGAIAATGGSGGSKATASAAKKGKPGPRGPRGKQGPAGPAGPQGPKGDAGAAGANGQNGLDGLDGKNGKDGKDGSTGSAGPAGPAGPTGATGPTGDTGAAGPAGPAGSPWTAGGTLPPGETETGSWGFGQVVESQVPPNFLTEPLYAPISFALPIPTALDEAHSHYLELGATPTANCPGSAANPEAAPGHLCVYTGQQNSPGTIEEAGFQRFFVTGITPTGSGGTGASRTGAALRVLILEKGAFALGTFAVTAPTSP